MSTETSKSNPWMETGRYEFETVCRSTLCPKEWLQVERIYVCECCLKTTIQSTSARRHRVFFRSFPLSHSYRIFSLDEVHADPSTGLFDLFAERRANL